MSAPSSSDRKATEPLFVARRSQELAVYVHFPYCIQKCHYCDFYSVGLDGLSGDARARTTPTVDMLDVFEAGVLEELAARRRQFERFSRVHTIFFGGGTASLLPLERLARLLDALRSKFDFADDCEITLEGNPENFTKGYCDALHQLGVTRVNVGVQTLQPERLDDMHRYYDPENYARIFSTLDASNIPRVGVDLMYGFPGQVAEDFFADAERALAKRIDHLSVYSLTVEESTPYAAMLRQKRMRAPEEGTQDEIFQALPEFLAARGLRWYEISNYARPGSECRHNLRYWLYEPYLGLGPGAHGFDGFMRYGNPRSIERWRSNPNGAELNPAEPLQELPLVLLRLTAGVPVDRFAEVLGASHPATRQAQSLFAEWERRGLGDVRLADSGERLFVWRLEGACALDDRVGEMISALEKAG